MATLTVSIATDFGQQALTNITLIGFTKLPLLSSATTTFNAAQFDDVQIRRDVQIDGSAGFNGIAVGGETINACKWTFSNCGRDKITSTGTSGDTTTGSIKSDTINAGTQNDLISGGLGADNLRGGAGNDTFLGRNASNMASGEVIEGGDGNFVLNGEADFRIQLNGKFVLTEADSQL